MKHQLAHTARTLAHTARTLAHTARTLAHTARTLAQTACTLAHTARTLEQYSSCRMGILRNFSPIALHGMQFYGSFRCTLSGLILTLKEAYLNTSKMYGAIVPNRRKNVHVHMRTYTYTRIRTRTQAYIHAHNAYMRTPGSSLQHYNTKTDSNFQMHIFIELATHPRC